MLPFMTQPAVAAACYVPKYRDPTSALFDGTDNALFRLASLGNRRKFTVAGCVLRGKLGAYQAIFGTQTDNNNNVFIRFQDTDELQFALTQASTQVGYRVTTGKYRDTAPLFFVASCDTTKGPGNNPMRLSVNGPNTPCTSLDPALNYDAHMNVAANQYIGRASWAAGTYLDGLVPNLIVVDGADLDWSAFFEQNIHGVWVWRSKEDIHAAIAAAGGFGVNGFHLDFSDPLQPGKDVSGQAHHFTATGIDAAGKDTVASTPTNVYATWHPLITNWGQGGQSTKSEGNLRASLGTTSLSNRCAYGSIPARTGKYYWEMTVHTVPSGATMYGLGVCTERDAQDWLFNSNGSINTGETGFTAYSSGAITGFALDVDAGKLWARVNGVWQRAGADPETGANPLLSGISGPVWPIALNHGTSFALDVSLNCGQRPFRDAPPAGFVPLCTDNLPEPAIKDPAEALAQASATGANIPAVLDAATSHWNGDAWVEIIKRREASEDWRLRFSDDPANAWATNNANAKGAAPALTAGGSYYGLRLRVGKKYGVWTAEVDHVNGTPTTVTHGLGVARNAVFATRVSVGGGDRYCRHPDMPSGHLGKLNSNAAVGADGTITAFGPDSFQISGTAPSGTYRVIVLAQQDGYLDIAKHSGNGVADGPLIPGTISPLFSLIRRTDAAAPWCIYDAARDPVNYAARQLQLNSAAGEISAAAIDFVSGGVKIRGITDINVSGGNYVSLSIGRPIGGVCVAPATAR